MQVAAWRKQRRGGGGVAEKKKELYSIVALILPNLVEITVYLTHYLIIFELSDPRNNLLFCCSLQDCTHYLYKWLMFWPIGLHQSQCEYGLGSNEGLRGQNVSHLYKQYNLAEYIEEEDCR